MPGNCKERRRGLLIKVAKVDLIYGKSRFKPKAHLPAIAVVKHYGNLPTVECCAGQLNQVFMNILANAIDALEDRDLRRSLRQDPTKPERHYHYN
jgi:two-component system NtrC family sensor kinase